MADDPRRVAPATARNRDPILAVLRTCLPPTGTVLEIASGTGEHVRYFAAALPTLAWQPSDAVADNLASIDAWATGLANVAPACALDAAAPAWPVSRADAVLCINMIHIAPWAAAQGLVAGAARILPPGGVLVLYGPFREAPLPLAPGNAAFDADLRSRDAAWGLREIADVAALAMSRGFDAPQVIAMPADNRMVVFRLR